MNPEWGRPDAAGAWPQPVSAWTTAAVLIAMLSAVAVGAGRYQTVWTPLQQHYLASYIRSAILSGMGAPNGSYQILQVIDRAGSRLAIDEEVAPVATAAGEPSWALTEAATRAGDRRLTWRSDRYPHVTIHALLHHWIYRDQGLVDLLAPALWRGLLVLAFGLAIALPRDAARRRARRHGRRLKGPELVTVRQFNQRTQADGVGFLQTPGLCDRLLRRRPSVRISRALEPNHLLIMGDSGTGKSALIRQLLQQLTARGATAIVYDPALEYMPEFYTPERGDFILNPLDARSPHWSPADEVRHEAEALTVAKSLFPDRHEQNPFFTEGPRRIFAHLLTLRPTPEDLAHWLRDDDELDRRLAGTAYAAMVDRQAPAQRSGIRGSLNMVADALQLLPAERDTARRWSAAAWSTDPRGWLFLTSTPQTRDRLLPLTSLWLDLLVLRLMHHGQPGPRPVWFMLDELASLQRLPQLHTAITENRKSQNPVVLGFQGRSQLETRYGHDAEAMISQPATKVFLRTSEPHAATWIADTIGQVEIERLAESRSSGRGGPSRSSTSYGLQRQVEPLVMASEIAGLAPLRGYLKVGNLVVRLRFPFVTLPHRHPGFVERRTPARPVRSSPSTPAPIQSPLGAFAAPSTSSPGHVIDWDRGPC